MREEEAKSDLAITELGQFGVQLLPCRHPIGRLLAAADGSRWSFGLAHGLADLDRTDVGRRSVRIGRYDDRGRRLLALDVGSLPVLALLEEGDIGIDGRVPVSVGRAAEIPAALFDRALADFPLLFAQIGQKLLFVLALGESGQTVDLAELFLTLSQVHDRRRVVRAGVADALH